MLKFKTKVKIKDLTPNDLILFLEEIWDSHYFSFEIEKNLYCHCFKINDTRIKSEYATIINPDKIIPMITQIKNKHFIDYYANLTPINANILKVFSYFKDNIIYVYRIEKYIHPLFTVEPFEWALHVIKNSENRQSIINPFHINLASSILYWRQHLLTEKNTVIKVNPTIYEDDILIKEHKGFIIGKLKMEIKISNPIQIDFPHILVRKKRDEYGKNMLNFWKNKVKVIGDFIHE